MKKVIIGFIAGVIFATAGTAVAQTVIEKVTATVRTDFTVELDGEKVELTNNPLAYNGSSYLPVKEISELMGKEVGFEDGVIKISTPTDEKESTEVTEGTEVFQKEAYLFDIPISEMNEMQLDMEISAAESLIRMNKLSDNNPNETAGEKELRSIKIGEAELIIAKLEARKAELEAQ